MMKPISLNAFARLPLIAALVLTAGLALSACQQPQDPELWHKANSTNPTGTGDFGPLDDPNTPGRSVLGPGG